MATLWERAPPSFPLGEFIGTIGRTDHLRIGRQVEGVLGIEFPTEGLWRSVCCSIHDNLQPAGLVATVTTDGRHSIEALDGIYVTGRIAHELLSGMPAGMDSSTGRLFLVKENAGYSTTDA